MPPGAGEELQAAAAWAGGTVLVCIPDRPLEAAPWATSRAGAPPAVVLVDPLGQVGLERGLRLGARGYVGLTDENIRYVVARHEERIVSTCTLTLIPNLTRGARPYGLIENVVTHPDFRRRGIGTKVLHHALQIAWGSDCF